MIFTYAKWFAVFLLFSGAFIGGWETGVWYSSSKELKQADVDYAELTKQFSDYAINAQKQVVQYAQQIEQSIASNKNLAQLQDSTLKNKALEIVAMQGQIDELRKVLSGLKATTCLIDVPHQQLLSQLSQAANNPTAAVTSGSKNSPTSNTNKSSGGVPGSN